MALILSDRVKETTTTTGASDFSLGGAVTGFQTFSAGVGNSNTTYYAVSLGADFEVGLGTLSGDGLTLARTTVLQSSNSDNKVLFAAGSKEVFVTYAADKSVFIDASGNANLDLNKIQDVQITSVSDNQILRYESATSLWKNKSLQTYLTVIDRSASTVYVAISNGYLPVLNRSGTTIQITIA
jgi:hypothetical protein